MAVAASKIIYLIACHVGTANHFIEWQPALTEKGYTVRIIASDPACQRFDAAGMEVFVRFSTCDMSDDERKGLAQAMCKTCCIAQAIITGVATPFEAEVQEALKGKGYALYENPERFVPGGWSEQAAQVMGVAGKVLFANKRLISGPLYSGLRQEIPLPIEKRVGIGFSPVVSAEQIREQRETSHAQQRSEFLARQGIPESPQTTVWGYLGGNNSVYFDRALPAFLSILSGTIQTQNLSHFVIVIQQHPGAKHENKDRQLIEDWMRAQEGVAQSMPRVVFSDLDPSHLQVVIDGVWYYQTTLNVSCILAGLPIFQIGHETYEDGCVSAGLCPSITNAQDFMCALADLQPISLTEQKQNQVYDALGLELNHWKENLEASLAVERK